MSSFKCVGVITKQGDAQLIDTLSGLVKHLSSKSLDILLDESAGNMSPGVNVDVVSRDELGQRCDLVIVIGGDGSFLDAACSLVDSQVPIMGVNRGRLGFLVDVSPEDMFATLDQVLSGIYKEERRFVLEAEIHRNSKVVARHVALNDIVIHVGDAARMIELQIYINERYVNTQRSDGLIVATPTGSTAHALSAGGPILHPTLDAIVVVPVCPHTLSNRPVVVDASSQIEILVSETNRSRALASFDGQSKIALQPDDRIYIHKKPELLRLIQPQGHDYFQILRAKLRWGEQP